MEIILLQDVKSLGKKGERVKINDGYARNFVLPKKLGIEATAKNLNDLKLQKANEDRIAAQKLEEAKQLAAKIEEKSVVLSVKTGEGGKLFGSVTAADLLAKIAEGGVELPKKAIHLAAPVKELGKHTAQIKLHHDVKVDFSFEVVSENPIEEPAAAEESKK